MEPSKTLEKLLLDPFYAEILEAAPDAVLVSDHGGRILFANDQAACIFGYSTGELGQINIDRLVPSPLRGHHQSLREKYFRDPHKRPMGIGMELIAEKKNGQPVDVEISLSALKIHGQRCVISIIRDVTHIREMARELNRHNVELKRSNEDLDRFAAIASHDLQEPLRVIGGYTQLIQKRYGSQMDLEGQEYLTYIFQGVKRLEHLIQDLLAFSRLTSRVRPFVTVNLEDILGQVLAQLDVLIQEKEAQISHDPLPMVMADPVQMTQLFQNLLANSLKFCVQKPVVKICVKRVAACWHIGVLDNGIGIPPEYRDKVFGIFQRLHTRESYSGTGVGLAICKRIMERHHGSIWIEDVPTKTGRPNKGIAIWVNLPAADHRTEE